jgi:hypothetical protein
MAAAMPETRYAKTADGVRIAEAVSRREVVMNDNEIIDRIRALVDEEHQMRDPGAAVDDARLARLEETLDQCWDLLRQRRARREFGEDPDQASVRDVDTVERYRQ